MVWHPCQLDPRAKPERGTCELDRDHPLARGLVGLWLFNEGAGARAEDATGGRTVGVAGGGYSWGVVCDASGGRFNGTNALVTADGVQAAVAGQTGTTLTITMARTATTHQVNVGFLTTGASKLGLTWFTDGNVYADSSSNSFVSAALAGTGVRRVSAAYNGSNGAPTRMQAYGSGALLATSLSGTPPTALPSAVSLGPLLIGRDAAANRWTTGVISDTALHARALSPAEVAWLHAEPYAMLRPIARRAYSVPASSSGRLLRLRRQAAYAA